MQQYTESIDINSCSKRARLKIPYQFLLDNDFKHNLKFKIKWHYVKNNEIVRTNIHDSDYETQLTLNLIPVNNVRYSEISNEYSCIFNVKKLHRGWGDPNIGMQTINNCDLMGYSYVLYFIKCKNDDGYSLMFIEVDEHSYFTLDNRFNNNIDINDKICIIFKFEPIH